MGKAVAVLACALVLSACVTAVSSAPFVSRAPNPADHEIRLYSTRLPTCPYEDIGLVHAKRRDLGVARTSLESAVDAVRRRAREMGGDAVVALGRTQTVDGGTVVGNTVSLGVAEGLAGTVIRFTDASCHEQDDS
jgi:hypothetical protein